MPELPEVETSVRQLRPELEGRRIDGVRVFWARTLGGQSPRAFERAVAGARIARLWRRGKYIVADLERRGAAAGALLVHLRMTGRLYVERAAETRDRFVKVELDLERGRVLRFLDVRKFGRMTYAPDAGVALASLGPEPLSAEFSTGWLARALGARRRSLKPLLLDQGFLAGLGNIYVDESLHGAGIHPLARSHRLDAQRIARLRSEIRRTLEEAIAREGSSFDRFYRTPEGKPGSYQERFRVYGRGGEPCRTCGTPITRSIVGQRSTHFCRRCQRR